MSIDWTLVGVVFFMVVMPIVALIEVVRSFMRAFRGPNSR